MKRSIRLVLGFLAAALVVCAAPAPRRTSFDAGSLFPAGQRPQALALADFDGDGSTDIATADGAGNTVSILRGNGRGGFAAPRSFPAMTEPHILAVGDVNGDRRPDLVVTSHDSNDAVILLNQKSGFERRVVPAFPEGKPHNHGLAVADINRDGRADLTFGHQDLGQVAVLLGGDFRAAPGSPVATPGSPYPHTLADVNADQKLDLVVPAVSGNAIRVLMGNGDGTFAPATSVSTGIARPYFVGVADFNRDARMDLVITHDDTSRVALLLGDGKGGFTHAPGSPFESPQRGSATETADLNADGKVDMAIAGGGYIQIFHGDGKGGMTRGPQLTLAADVWRLRSGDLNRDGRIDLVAPAAERNAVQVFLAR